jgi:hypothetical protein
MIDWNKPLTYNNNKVYFVGFTPCRELAVVSYYNGLLFKAFKNTGVVFPGNSADCRVKNVEEPWEEAFKEYALANPGYCIEEETFRHGFEAGRSWKE